MIWYAFKKCGISVAIDGSEYTEINVHGMEWYIAAALIQIKSQKMRTCLKSILLTMNLLYSA